MKENTQEKDLIEKNENSIFGKIKNFFKNLFGKKEIIEEESVNKKEENNNFKEYIKMTETEETKLLELQEKYHNGEISEGDLTDEQIDELCLLYDKQIEEIKKSIKVKEEKLAEYKKRNKRKVEEKKGDIEAN